MNNKPEVTELRLVVTAPDYEQALEFYRDVLVSAATAKTHVSRLLMKLDAHDRAQLVMIAYETGLVTPG